MSQHRVWHIVGVQEMAAAVKSPTRSAGGLPVTLTLHGVHLAGLVPIPRLRAVPWGPQGSPRKQGKCYVPRLTENTKPVGAASCRPHTAAELRSGSRCPHSSPCTLLLSGVRVRDRLVLLSPRCAGPEPGGCSGRGGELWGCFSPDVGGEELRLLLSVHPLPHSQLPAHRPFLFCCELQFPWAPH